MPENAYRLAHLRSHSTGVYAAPIDPVRDLAVARHRDWPLCTACGYPVDPAAGASGSTHPGCTTETTAGAEPAEH